MAQEGRSHARHVGIVMVFSLLAWQPVLGFVGRIHRLSRRRNPAAQISCRHIPSPEPENRRDRRAPLGALFAWTSRRAPPFRRNSNFPGEGSRLVPASSTAAAAAAAAGTADADGPADDLSASESGGNDSLSGGGMTQRAKVAAKAMAILDGSGAVAAAAGEQGEEGKGGVPPKWVAPRWAVDMHPATQAAAGFGLYLVHMFFLSKSGLTFPIQLIPNNHGLCQSVGLDTAAGFAVLGAVGWTRVRSGMPLFPPIGPDNVPWKLDAERVKKKLPTTFVVLIIAYLLSGMGSSICDYVLYGLSLMGITMSVAMHRSVQVLMSHFVWVLMGVRILKLAIKPFFDKEKGSWVGMKWRSTWLWWVLGGYYVSAALFNMADLANQFVCPLLPETESVVVKIINPENNDVAAMAIGSIAPCFSAPWWEEVLYRGFLLPALTLYIPLKAALPTGSVIFAAHHMNLQAMFPLSVLGLIWSLLYLFSGNMMVTVLIHAMWNSRVFLGSFLGL
eukprot:jgi/Undpi1/1034/HiC_scaffold_10.g04498.m1